MPDANTALLPLCIGLSLIGVVVVAVAFLRGRRGRAVQGLALALAPVALYLSGLLRLVWDAVVAVVRWASDTAFDLRAWVGLGLLVLCVVLWVVGGVVARRSRRRTKAATAKGAAGPGQVGTGAAPAGPAARAASGSKGRKPAASPQDDDMAEIEELLRSRGIQ